MGQDLRKERIHLVVALLLSAVPVTADKLIYGGCGGICALDPVPGATPVPLIPGLNDAVYEEQPVNPAWRNEVLGVVTHDLSPDGYALAFVMLMRHTVGATDIWTVNLDGTDLKILLRQERYYRYYDKYGEEKWDIFPASLFGLSWSPEGDLLAYTDALPGREFSGYGPINYLIPDGTPPDSVHNRQRTHFHSTPAGSISGRGNFLDWHPDGRLFFSDYWMVYSINRDGSGLTDSWGVGTNHAISPSGLLAYTRNDSIFVRNPVPDRPPPVYVGQGCCPAWSPDSQRIAYFADEYLRVMNADGSGQVDICPYESDRKFITDYFEWDLDWIGEPEQIPTAIQQRSWGQIKQEHR